MAYLAVGLVRKTIRDKSIHTLPERRRYSQTSAPALYQALTEDGIPCPSSNPNVYLPHALPFNYCPGTPPLPLTSPSPLSSNICVLAYLSSIFPALPCRSLARTTPLPDVQRRPVEQTVRKAQGSGGGAGKRRTPGILREKLAEGDRGGASYVALLWSQGIVLVSGAFTMYCASAFQRVCSRDCMLGPSSLLQAVHLVRFDGGALLQTRLCAGVRTTELREMLRRRMVNSKLNYSLLIAERKPPPTPACVMENIP